MANKDLNAYLNAAQKSNGNPPLDLNSALNNAQNKSRFTSSSLGSGEFLDYGENIADTRYLDSGFTRFSPYDAHELQAYNQGSFTKFGTMFPRIANKALGEIAKMPGVIGGIGAGTVGQIGDLFTGEDNTDFVKTAFDNEWIKAINESTENINKEYLPVYVKNAIETGSLTDKIFTPDFWATEGADGIGYIVSMLVPGAVIGKLGLGAKFGNMLGKTQKAREVLTKIGFAGKAADIKMATLANTLFEAGAEAQGAMETYRNTLTQKLEGGEITEDEYNSLMKEDSVVGANVFGANAAILVGPNYLMSKMMLGTKGMSKMGITASETEVGKLASTVAKPTVKEYGKQFAKGIGTATVREGFWEEGMQSTAEQYFTEKQINKNSNKDFLTAYSEMLGSTQGQTAIFLGAFLGGGMTGVGNVQETKARYENSSKLVDQFNKGIESFTDFNKKDLFLTKIQNGQEVLDLDEKGQPQINPVKLVERMQSLNGSLNDNLIYQNALAQGNTKLAELLQEKAIAGFVSNFISQGELGIETLQEYLKDSPIVDEYVKDSENVEKDKKEFVEKIMNKAKKMQSSYEMFTNFKDVIKLRNPNALPEDVESFQNKLLNSYLGNSVEIDYNERKLKEVQDKKRLFFQNSIYDESVLDGTNDLLKQELLKDERLQEIVKEESIYKKELEKVRKKESDFFKSENYTKEFAEEIERNAKIRETTSQEEADKAEKVIKDVNSAESKEDLDKVLAKDDNEEIIDEETERLKLEEFNTLQDIVNTINDNKLDLDVLQGAVEILKETKFNSYNVQKLVNALQYRINTIIKEQESFDLALEKIGEDFLNKNEILTKKLSEIEKRIQDNYSKLEEKRKQIQEKQEKVDKYAPKTTSKKAVELREIVKILKEDLKNTESEIKTLEADKIKVQEELKLIEIDVNNLINTMDMNVQTKFRSFEELKSYLESRASQLQDHRFNVARLLTQQFYTEQEVEALTNTIESLKNYKDVLNETIKSLLKTSNPMDGVETENLAFLSNELNTVLNNIEEFENKLFKEQDKLNRINESLKDKLELNLIKEELKILEDLSKVVKKKPKSTAFQNIKIQEVISEKQKIVEEKELAKEALQQEHQEKEEDETQIAISELETLYPEGTEITVTKALAVAIKQKGIKQGVKIVIQKITKDRKLKFSFNGKIFTIDLNTFFDAFTNTTFNESTEGKDDRSQNFDTYQSEESISTNGSKILSTDDNGLRLPFINPEFLDFERNPNVVKVGQKVTFEINTDASGQENWRMALSKFNNKDFSDIEFLIKYLPINVVFENGQKAPLYTYFETKDRGSQTFDKSTKKLRAAIVKELQSGSNIKDLNTVVEGQYNGELQLEEEYTENALQDLFQFGGNIENITSDIIYFADDKGVLKNNKGIIHVSNTKLAPGSVYILIKTAAGNNFPLKVNISKISISKAEILYELYKYRFDDILNKNKNITLSQIEQENSELVRKVLMNFSDELKIIGKSSVKDTTIKDIVDFMIWDGTNNIKSRVRFGPEKLIVGDMEYTKEQFESSKDEFVQFLTNNKRHHIRIKPFKGTNSKVHIGNKEYLKYLLNRKILNTNAKVGSENYTFQGKTSMYLDSFNLKVNINGEEKVSTYNEKRPLSQSDNSKVIITKEQLLKNRPKLLEDNFKLKVNDESKYVDKEGNEYNRVTSLKSDTKNKLDVNSTVRGNVIDSLLREHFSNMNTISKQAFVKRGFEFLEYENKIKHKDESNYLKFEEKAFEELYNILEEYKQLFLQKGIKIYSTLPTVGGIIGSKGRIAGTVDLIGYDEKNKHYVIIDLKTSSTNRALQYSGKLNDTHNTKLKDQVQLNAYRELFNQTEPGMTIGALYIIPLTVPDKKNISTIVKNSEEDMLLEVSIEKDIYELLSIDKTKTVTKPIVKTTTKPTTTTKTSEKIVNNVSSNAVRQFNMMEEQLILQYASGETEFDNSKKINFTENKKSVTYYYNNSLMLFRVEGNEITLIENIEKARSILTRVKSIKPELIDKYYPLPVKEKVVEVKKPQPVKNNSENVRKSEKNSVSLQESKKVDSNQPPLEMYDDFVSAESQTEENEFIEIPLESNRRKVNFSRMNSTINEEVVKEEIKSESVVEKTTNTSVNFKNITEELADDTLNDLLDEGLLDEDMFISAIMSYNEGNSSAVEILKKVNELAKDSEYAKEITNKLKGCN
jgi:hypothetical protein